MQKESTRGRHWLFPFTQDVDLPAIDAVLRLAQARGVTPIAISLLPVQGEQLKHGISLELIQQSRDFLEAARFRACRLGLTLKWSELYTSDASCGLMTLATDLNCERIVLVMRGTDALLLDSQEMQKLIQLAPNLITLVRLPARVPHGSRERLFRGLEVAL